MAFQTPKKGHNISNNIHHATIHPYNKGHENRCTPTILLLAKILEKFSQKCYYAFIDWVCVWEFQNNASWDNLHSAHLEPPSSTYPRMPVS